MKLKNSLLMPLSAVLLAGSFVGCSTTPAVYTKSIIKYNNQKETKQELFKEILHRSKYGLYSGINDYGISGRSEINGKFVVKYINSRVDSKGNSKFNIVKFTVPYIFIENEFFTGIEFSKNYKMDKVKTQIDSLDNIKNIERDFKNMIYDKKNDTQYFDKIDFDPKKVVFGIASSVKNSKVKNGVLSYDGYLSTGCSYDHGCSKNTYFQSIDVIPNGMKKVIHVVQVITDDRYDFIHNGDKVNLFQMENGKWIVKTK